MHYAYKGHEIVDAVTYVRVHFFIPNVWCWGRGVELLNLSKDFSEGAVLGAPLVCTADSAANLSTKGVAQKRGRIPPKVSFWRHPLLYIAACANQSVKRAASRDARRQQWTHAATQKGSTCCYFFVLLTES